jgi:hypothetical protein
MSINLVPEHTLPKSFFFEEEPSSKPCAAVVERVALHEPEKPARATRTELDRVTASKVRTAMDSPVAQGRPTAPISPSDAS